MKKVICFLLVLIFTINLVGCQKSTSGDSVKCWIPEEPKTLDPQSTAGFSSNTVVMNLFEGLTKLDQDGNIQPAAAKSWQSAQDVTFTFFLKENLHWNDKTKTPLTANDFLFGLQRALTKSPTPPTNLFNIKNAEKIYNKQLPLENLGVTVLNDLTIKFDLEAPDKNFSKTLSAINTFPCNKGFFESTNGQYGLESNKILCNGPFKLKDKEGWEHYKSITLVKNANYHSDVKLGGINFLINKDINNVVSTIKNGKLDFSILPNEELTTAKNENLQIKPYKTICWGLKFNTDNPTFNNLNIRKSILSSLNRNHIIKNLGANYHVWNDLIPKELLTKNHNDALQSKDQIYVNQDSNAIEYLKKGLAELKLPSLPDVTLLCLSNAEIKSTFSNIIENLNNSLKHLFNIEPLTQDALTKRLESKNYTVALAPITISSPYLSDFAQTLQKEIINDFKNDSTISRTSPTLKKKVSPKKTLEPKEERTSPTNTAPDIIELKKYIEDNYLFYPICYENSCLVFSNKLKDAITLPYDGGVDFRGAYKVK